MSKPKKFKLKPGQTDFRKIRWTPVVNCVVKYKNKILLVKRNSKMHLYPAHWNGISGFLDDLKSLKEKVKEELKEEIGITSKNIKSIKLGEIFNQEAPKYKKTWIIHPVLVEIAKDKINLDWEAEDYKWINPKEAKKFELVPGFEKVIENTLKL